MTQCKPMADPERRDTKAIGIVYVWIVQRRLGTDGGGMPIVGSIVDIGAFVSYFDVSAWAEKYESKSNSFHIEKRQIPLRAGITYAG